MYKRAKPPSLIIFFAIAYGFSWLFWGSLALAENGYLTLPEGFYDYLYESNPAAWGPLIGALSAAYLASGSAGLRELFARMIRVNFGAVWYLICIALIPALVWLAGFIATSQGAALPPSEVLANPAALPIAFVVIFFMNGPLQEEAGWRGTATDSLHPRLGALGASLFVGVLWGLWHLPLFFMPREEIYYNQPIWGLVGSTMLLAVLITWVYNNTGKSLFAAMLMHASFNWSNWAFTTLQHDAGGMWYFILLFGAVAIVTLVFGPKTLTR